MKKHLFGITTAIFIQILLLSPVLAAEEAPTGSDNASWAEDPDIDSAFVSPAGIMPSDTVLDISPNATDYIDGALSINYEDFFDRGGGLKTVSEVAGRLGDAGITSNDSLIIAGECMPCGGGPAPAFFTYWLLKYLGHEDVRILTGTADDWKAAGLNLSHRPSIRTRAEYMPRINADLLATYEFVAAGGAQIVDARLPRDYEIGSIPGAVNIPYEYALENGSLRSREQLQEIFSGIGKDRAVVVYTNVGIEAAITWFALERLGFDARLYSWRSWLEMQPQFGFELAEIKAEPNPVKAGQPVYITAILQSASANSTRNSPEGNSSRGEDKLEVKGCATCGFGSPQGFADLNRKDGAVQIGSSGVAPSSSEISGQRADRILRCTAVINFPDGSEAARMNLLETTTGKYMGIWNAEMQPGIYTVSIVATADGNSETFADVLEIEVRA
ncbi:MAG TPA: rhodanese-like domain-containing protein [Methanothrix sp.]|nr:rhodanese-like domain-containing protein [Methanothrix sp.]